MDRSATMLQEWLQQYNRILTEWQEEGNRLTPEIAREGLAALTRTYTTDFPDISLVVDETVSGGRRQVPVRIYHPEKGSAIPLALFFHGGGHMVGSVDVYDSICRKVARASGRIVVAVEYRLAPEHPYPAALEDGGDVLEGCVGMLDRIGLDCLPQIALVGDSAGGAMSATLAHRFQDAGGPEIDRLCLIYPSLDYTLSRPSANRLATGYLLEKEKIEWYFERYFQNNEDRRNASPLFMEVGDRFPSTMVITAGLCPLQDEGVDYVKNLKRQGISVTHLHLETMVHAFLNLENLVSESCRTCYRELGTFLRKS